MVWTAAALMAYMCYAYTSPFSGVEMRGNVMTIEQISEYAQVEATGFLLPVYTDIPTDSDYYSGELRPAFYLEPGQEVGIVGVIYNWYHIHHNAKFFWVDSRFIITDPSQLNKGE